MTERGNQMEAFLSRSSHSWLEVWWCYGSSYISAQVTATQHKWEQQSTLCMLLVSIIYSTKEQK